MNMDSRRVSVRMSPVSRRMFLGLPPLAIASAMMTGIRRSDRPDAWRDTDPMSRYLMAVESPTYDQSFAVFVESLSVAAGDELVVKGVSRGPVDLVIERVSWGFGTARGDRRHSTSRIAVASVASGTSQGDWPTIARHRQFV
jgi:hypothetical protein